MGFLLYDDSYQHRGTYGKPILVWERGSMGKKLQMKYVYRYMCALIIIFIATFMFGLMWMRFVTDNNQTGHLTGTGNVGMAFILYLALFLIIGCWLHAFRIGVDRKASVMASVALTAITVDVIEIFVSMIVTGQFRFFYDFLWRYIVLCLAQIVILCLLVIPMINIYRKKFPALRVLEVYGERSHGLHDKMNGITYKYHVNKLVHYSISNEELREEIQNHDAVLISDVPAHEKNLILKTCVDMNKRVYFVPKISDVITASAEKLNLIDTPLFLIRDIGLNTVERFVKRIMDIILSSIALIVCSPLFIIVAIAIKVNDGGPIFYRQERCTIGGKKFMILKFRSMIVDAEKDGRPHPAGEKDDRITKVGNVIRATRVDELPQIINILKGDMSIVGPRPERVEHVEKYTEEIPEFTFRSKVKGGLTGYAQVYGKYNTTALDKLKLDLIYIMNYSILLDLQIIFETVKILFRKDSTEGFSEEKVEEMHDFKGYNS